MPTAKPKPKAKAKIAPGPVASRLAALVALDDRSVSQIAREIGLPQPNLHVILSGANSNPKVETVQKILAGLGCSWADLDAPARKGGRP